jgi:hypothetical protein
LRVLLQTIQLVWRFLSLKIYQTISNVVLNEHAMATSAIVSQALCPNPSTSKIIASIVATHETNSVIIAATTLQNAVPLPLFRKQAELHERISAPKR